MDDRPTPAGPPDPGADGTPGRAGRLRSWWRGHEWQSVAGLGGAVAVVLLLVVLVATLHPTSPAPAPSPSTVTQTSLPSPAPSSAPAAAASRQQKAYRAYLVTVLTQSTALTGATLRLATCWQHWVGRANCEQAVALAEGEVRTFQTDLDKNPAPACLATADSRLRTGLDLQQRGLQLVSDAMHHHDRLQLGQGLILLTAGQAAIVQALRQGRKAQCA